MVYVCIHISPKLKGIIKKKLNIHPSTSMWSLFFVYSLKLEFKYIKFNLISHMQVNTYYKYHNSASQRQKTTHKW